MEVLPTFLVSVVARSYEVEAIKLEAITTRSKKLLGAPGIATRSKDATRGSWPSY